MKKHKWVRRSPVAWQGYSAFEIEYTRPFREAVEKRQEAYSKVFNEAFSFAMESLA